MTFSSNEQKHTSSNPLRNFAIEQFFKSVIKMMPPVTRILDAGCGEGYAARKLLAANPYLEILGIDCSLQAITRAREICPQMSSCIADVTELPLLPNSVELVLSLEVLEHLPNPSAAIERFKIISNRYLMLSVPNEPVFRISRMFSGQNIMQFGDHPEHIQHWNLFTFQTFLRKQGLRILCVSSPLPFVWSIVLCEVP